MAKRKRKPSKSELNKLNRITQLLNQVESGNRNEVSKPLEPRLKTNEKSILISQIKVSDHAVKRARERFSNLESRSDKEIRKYLIDVLANATYIGQVSDVDGGDSEMFVNGKHVFHMSPDLTTIKTVIKIEKSFNCRLLNEKLYNVIQKEFNKLHRNERAKIKRYKLLKLEVECEMAEVRLRQYKTKSKSVEMACQARLNALEQALNDHQNEINKIQSDKRSVAYALAQII